MTPSRRGILLLAMYPVREARSGPEVRIRHILTELRRLSEVDVVDGHRMARRLRLWRYLLSGRLRGLRGVYVESSTALPSETDIAFIWLARLLGLPVITYVRDAYQLFPDYYPIDSTKRRIAAWLFPWAVRALRAASTQLAFPSRGLAAAVLGQEAGDDALLLPPGAREPVDVPTRGTARGILFVGDMRIPAQGGATLLAAVATARQRGGDLDLICVTRPGGEPEGPYPEWLRLERASSEEIIDLLPDVVATVIPRAAGAYNDLALPIKLMEYLSYGRPLIVTDRTETAAVVREAGCGLVVGDGAGALADGLLELHAAGPARRAAWAAAARAAAARHAWSHRARQILDGLGQ